MPPYVISQGNSHGKFVEISDSTIRDKSKADTLAKRLDLLQVSWMLVLTIPRRIVGYPITSLEVHTPHSCGLCRRHVRPMVQEAAGHPRSSMGRYL